MKRLTLIHLLIAFSTIFSLKAQDRTMMNVVWQQTFGEPSEIEWAASTLDHNGDLLTTGHAKNAQGNSELLLNKTSPEGAVIWTEHTPQPTAVKRTFGTAISSSSSGEIFAAGARSSDGTDDLNNYFIVKSASDGSMLWSQEFDGSGNGNDIPTAITHDTSGDVYVTGLSLGDGSELDFYTLKLSGTDGSILWQKRYDRYNLYDVPVSIDLDVAGNVIVIGASAKNFVEWEIVALKYAANGTLLTESIIENETLAFEKPSAFAKDDSGNIFITGITTQDGSNFDMKTVKLDSDLNLLWKKKFDYHKIDSTSAINVDAVGNAIVTGWSSNESSGTEFMTLKYSPTGELLWHKKRTTDRTTAKAKAFAVKTDAENNIIITGNIDYGEKSIALVTQYSPDGQIMWEKKLAVDNYERHRTIAALLNDEGDIFITGIGKQVNDRSYTSFKITRKKRDLIPETDDFGNSLYVKNEIIVRIEPEHLNMDFVDNTALRYGKVSDIISNTDAITAIDEALGTGVDFGNWCMIKVHRRLTSQLNTVTSRTGKTLGVPDFWATFILVVSERYEGFNRTPRVMNMLNNPELKKYIRYAELNRYTHKDDECPPDDARWEQQGNLHKITYQGTEYDAHINMEPGWCVETGNDALKVGIMDSGLFWAHEDYGDGTFDGSVIDGGFDYQNDTDLSANANNDNDNHGTLVAGLIGAIRNNEIGVGAIAGGDDGTGGIRLHGYKCLVGSIDNFYDAYADAVLLDAMDVINTSGGTYVNDDGLNSDQQTLREHIHFANRMGVIQMGSMGNDAIEYGTTASGIDNIARYPGMTQDEWVLSVGASGLIGQYEEYSNFGEIIDVVAPANWQLNRSTSTNPSNLYEGISFTSGATPNVSGLAALLASHYLDNVLPSDQNLVQEDVEYIIQRTADDIDEDLDGTPVTVDYDKYTGFGKINAGNALELVDRSNCNIFHFGKEANAGQSINYQSEVEEDVIINLTEPYINDAGQIFPAGTYTVDVFKVTATFQHDLPIGFMFDDAWARHSNATVLQKYDTDGNLRPVEKVEIVAVDENSITLEGYVYKSPLFGYMPQFLSSNETDLTYSVLACQLTNTDNPKLASLDFKVYPNPTTDLLGIAFTLEQTQEVRIEIIDTQGRVLKSKKQQFFSERTTSAIHVDNLPTGVYHCRIVTPTLTVTKKFIKI